MRLRRLLGSTTALAMETLVLGACAHGRAPPPPPPPPSSSSVIRSDATGVVVQSAKPAPTKGQRVKGREIDPACRFCVTDDPAKRQYFDQRRNRYYYFDRVKKQYFWEDGEPKA